MATWGRAGIHGAGIAAVLFLTACGSLDDRPRRPPPRAVSPNGEPLGGPGDRAACIAAQAEWVRRVDQNGDGRLHAVEFKADAARWFARIDADRDGFVTAAELAQTRLAMGFTAGPVPMPVRDRNPRDLDRRGDRPGERDSRPLSREDRVRAIPEAPDPVMEADTNLDFRVSAAEFEALTNRRFAALSQGRGAVTAEDAGRVCASD